MSEHGPVHDNPPGHTTHPTSTQLQHALEHVNQPIYILDTDKHIQYVNNAFTTLTGYNEPDIINDTPHTISNGHMPDEYYTELWDTVENGDTHETTDFVIQTRTGEILHTHQTVTPVTDDTNTITEYVAAIRDTTDYHIKKQQVHTFSRVLRHDMRTKTNIIIGYLNELRPHTDNNETANNHINTAENSTEDIIALAEKINNIQTTSINDEDVYGTTENLDSLIDTVVETIRETHSPFTVTVTTPDHAVHTTSIVREALHEIIENAVEHDTTNTRTHITITVETHDTTPPVTTNIIITDNGPGIQRNEIDVLENTTETSLEHGDGLGIWHARWVVTRAGGTISITTPPDHDDYDHGTQATLTLPFHQP